MAIRSGSNAGVTLPGATIAKTMALKTVKRETWLAKHAAKTDWPKIEQYISPDPDNADTALVLLGVAAPNPARADIGLDRAQLLLEPCVLV